MTTKNYLRNLLLVIGLTYVACEETCPKQCFCNKGYTSVNCEGKRISEVPIGIPKSVVKLYLGHNILNEIDSSKFGVLPNLRFLFLESNKIQRLQQKALSGTYFPSLQQVKLDNNQVTAIDKNAFEGLTYLSTIFLVNNYITVIHEEAFTGTHAVSNLHLDSNNLSNIPNLGQLTQLQNLYLEANKITNATFPAVFEGHTRLGHIGLSNNKITKLENVSFYSLRSSAVSKVELSRNKLNQISPTTFSPLTSLRSLYLGWNPLTASDLKDALFGLKGKPLVSLNIENITLDNQLPSSTFHLLRNSSIERLFLSNNKIRTIPSNSFVDMPHLITLDLSGSGIFSVSDSAFQGLDALNELLLNDNQLSDVPRNLPPTLRHLYLNGNQIKALENDVFSNLGDLQWLYLGHNKIVTLRERSFHGLVNLQKLHVVQNIIGTLPGQVFQPLTRLVSLELNKNDLKTIRNSPDVFSSMVSLEYLNIADNDLSLVQPKLFTGLKSLNYLHLQRNSLGQMIQNDKAGLLFMGLDKLQTLDLSNNEITSLHDKHFRSLHSMSELHIKGNMISGWGPDLFKHASSLTLLDLSSNRISLVNSSNVRYFNDLKSLNLTGNPLACTCDMRWFRDWVNRTSTEICNVSLYKCNSPKEWAGKPFLTFDRTKINCIWYTRQALIIAAAVGGGIVFIAVIFLIILIYRKRWFIRLRLYRLTHRVRTVIYKTGGYEPIRGQDYIYDAYISYAEDDYQWVLKNILPDVDTGSLGDTAFGGKFKLYFEDRDSEAGKSWIANFADNFHVSRKAIVILSPNYLNRALCNFELETAITYMSKGEIEDLIIVINGIEPQHVPKLLRNKIEKRDFLEWENLQDAEKTFKEELIRKLEQKYETAVEV